MRFGLRKRWAALGVLTTLIAGAAAPSATAAAAVRGADSSVPGPVVLLGTGGLRWSDVTDEHPALSGLQEAGSSGWLAVRSVRSTTCPADGWLGVSAGARAGDASANDGEAVCRDPQVTVGQAGQAGTVDQWDRYLSAAQAEDFDAKPGLLGDTLAANSVDSAAVGAGAAIALADSTGGVANAWAGSTDDPEQLAADVDAALATGPEVLAVDLGAVIDPAEQEYKQPKNIPALTGAYARPRAEQVTALEQRLEAVLAELPNDATVYLASLADSGSKSRLRVLAATGPVPGGGDYGDSLLGSSSTRQDGLAQTTDLFPTILSGLGVSVPESAVGSVVRPAASGMEDAARERKLLDIDQASIAVTPIVPVFFVGIVVAQVVLYLAATFVMRRRSRSLDAAQVAGRRIVLLRWLRRVAVVFACIPAATFLANLLPWWRADHSGLAATAATILFVIPMALIANLGPWKHALLGPMGAAGGMTMLVLGADVVTGSHLMLSSMMGLQPVVAGRFYGFGNPAFAIFATGSLLLAVALADTLVRRNRRLLAAAAVGVVGIVATIIDGTPGWGSDFGGPPAIIPGFAVLALLALGIRITLRRAVLIAGVTIVAITLIALLDWLRGPEQRTHLGRFAQTVLDGGAFTVIQRKAAANLDILFTSHLTILVPFAVAFVVLVLARPVSWGVRPLQLVYDRSPVLKAGLISFGVMMLIGFGVNDSGVAIPAVAATVALPLLIAISVRALELADTDPLPAAEVAKAPAQSEKAE
ncbi:glycosyltransferase family protein [Kineosporia babensis]|uniref:Uncharacterized protein n=1 Tax=Kineosporia babensis TaxID=499548 RepID=A0A9X1NIE4_9ACTN|nr:hypothetical protein [Kineosporia babensis]MCD5314630.1 hypothetical protein [Kineosporia babensis]